MHFLVYDRVLHYDVEFQLAHAHWIVPVPDLRWWNSDAYANPNSDAHTNTNTNTNTNSDTNSDTNTDTDTNSDTDTNTDTNTDSNAGAGAERSDEPYRECGFRQSDQPDVDG